MTALTASAGWHYRAVALSVVASAVGYLLFSLWAGWQPVSHAVLAVGLGGTLLALGMSLVNYGLRFLRWQTYLKLMGHPLAWAPSWRIYLAGFALTTTPGKAGEALRGVLLKAHGVAWPTSFAAFFSERLSDLFAVVLLTLCGLSLYPQARPLIFLGLGLVGVGLLVLSQARLLVWLNARLATQPGCWARLLGTPVQVLMQAQRCHRPAVLAWTTALSVMAWSAEAMAFHWILGWMGADVPLAFAMFVYALAMLAGAISFMPGGLGGTEAVMVGLLVWKGMPGADAVAATVLIRLATLWFAVGLGALMLMRCRRSARV